MIHSRLSSSRFILFTSTGLLVSSYFLWPSKYRGSPTFRHRPLSPDYFIPVTVSDNSKVGPDLAVLTLSLPPDSRAGPSLEPIWSIFIKEDDIQVERPYTPLCGLEENGKIRVWIKRYQGGQVGSWLHSKQAGDTIEIRGPSKTFPFYQGRRWDHVLMISGGTGFSPFHQLLFRQLVRGDHVAVTEKTRFTLLHASRTLAELPPLPLLQPLIDFAVAHPEHFRVQLFVDGPSSGVPPPPESIVSHLKVGRIDKSSIARSLGISDKVWTWSSWISSLWVKGQRDEDIRDKNVLVLVCGPERMVAAIAGPYGKNYSQGTVGGVLAELGFEAGQVWKL